MQRFPLRFIHTRQDRDCNQPGCRSAQGSGSLPHGPGAFRQHLRSAYGMDIEDIRTEPGQDGQAVGHCIRDVLQLQVEEDLFPPLFQIGDHFRAGTVEKFHPHFIETDGVPQFLHHSFGFRRSGKIKGRDEPIICFHLLPPGRALPTSPAIVSTRWASI